MPQPLPILGIDCALGGLGVSLFGESSEIAGFADPALSDQAARLLPVIETLMATAGLAYADLAGIAVTIGPGGFTGVRIGLAAARGLAFAAGLPLFGVTTLALLAEGRPSPLLAMLPAGRGLFYVQAFPDDDAPRMIAADGLAAAIAGRPVVTTDGPWLSALPPDTPLHLHPSGENARLAAAMARRRGFGAPASDAVPLYIRPPDAKPQAPLAPATTECRVD